MIRDRHSLTVLTAYSITVFGKQIQTFLASYFPHGTIDLTPVSSPVRIVWKYFIASRATRSIFTIVFIVEQQQVLLSVLIIKHIAHCQIVLKHLIGTIFSFQGNIYFYSTRYSLMLQSCPKNLMIINSWITKFNRPTRCDSELPLNTKNRRFWGLL